MLGKKVCFDNNTAILTNPELGDIFKQMEISIIRLMQKLEVIP